MVEYVSKECLSKEMLKLKCLLLMASGMRTAVGGCCDG